MKHASFFNIVRYILLYCCSRVAHQLQEYSLFLSKEKIVVMFFEWVYVVNLQLAPALIKMRQCTIDRQYRNSVDLWNMQTYCHVTSKK